MNRETREGLVHVSRALATLIYKRFPDTYSREAPAATTQIMRACHLLWCCNQIEAFVRDGQFGKAMRWLGFVQGVITWGLDAASIDDMANMNRTAKLGGTL